MSRRHWDGLALLARMVGSTPSGVLSALVEQAVEQAVEAIGLGPDDEADDEGWERGTGGYGKREELARLIVSESPTRKRLRWSWEVSWEDVDRDVLSGRCSTMEEAQAAAVEAYAATAATLAGYGVSP
jgi:hypothetical protein